MDRLCDRKKPGRRFSVIVPKMIKTPELKGDGYRPNLDTFQYLG